MARPRKRTRRPVSGTTKTRPRSSLSAWRSVWTGDAIAVAGLLTAVAVFFWPVLTGKAFLWTDFPERIYPIRMYAAAELQAGRFPFWNPYLFGGIPFFAMIDNAVLYPLSWIFIPLVRDGFLSLLAVEWHTIFHIFLLGLGTYYCCRIIGMSRAGAFIAGLTWMCSGPVVHHVFHGEMVHTIAWFPIIFLLLVRALDRLSFRLAVGAGTVWGIAILAGHPQIFMYMAYAMGLYFFICLLECLRSSERRRDAFRLTGVFAVAMGIGLGLSAAVFLPAYELVQYSQRGEVGYDMVTTYSFEPRQLITFLMPDFFGQMSPSQWDYWGPGAHEYGHFWETHVYMGILPLLLAGAAVVGLRGRFITYFIALAALCFLVAIGDATPGFRAIYELAPGFDKLRAHARAGMMMGFAVAVLSGFGLDAIQRMRNHEPLRTRIRLYLFVMAGLFIVGLISFGLFYEPITRWIAGSPDLYRNAQDAFASCSGRAVIFVLLSLGVAAWPGRLNWKTVHTGLAAILIMVDLLYAGYGFNQDKTDPETLFPKNEIVQFLQESQQKEGGRANLRLGRYMLLKRNAGMFHHIYTLEGYMSPLKLAETFPPAHSLELMNVKYRIHLDEENRYMRLISHETPSAHAFVVRHYLTAGDREATAQAMSDSSFNYRTTVVLDDTLEMDIPIERAIAPENPVVTHYEPNRMDVEVDMARPGILVVSEVYYPAWKAYVDGRPRRIYRANDTLRAVPLPAGRHTVTFRYESIPFRVGGGISILTLTLVIATGILSWRERRRAEK